jgi:hypothetical protein
MNKEIEIWKDIRGYKGLYQVSNLGNVKSLANDSLKKEKILKPGINSAGIKCVVLNKNKTRKSFTVGKLVASTFLNISLTNKIRVKYIDENKLNNRLDNLKIGNIREPKNDIKIENFKDKLHDKCDESMSEKYIGKKAKGLEFINVEDGELTHDHIEKERNKYINKIGIIRTIDKNDFTIDFGTAYFSYPIILLNEALSIEENNSNEIKTPSYYDNSKGSLYQVANQRGWNAYLFDIVKRLERGGKKDPLKQEIEKSIAVLQLWLKELEPTDKNPPRA